MASANGLESRDRSPIQGGGERGGGGGGGGGNTALDNVGERKRERTGEREERVRALRL